MIKHFDKINRAFVELGCFKYLILQLVFVRSSILVVIYNNESSKNFENDRTVKMIC